MIDSLKEQIERSINRHEISTSCCLWKEDYPGANALDELCADVSIKNGVNVTWEDMSATNNSSHNVVFSIEY